MVIFYIFARSSRERICTAVGFQTWSPVPNFFTIGLGCWFCYWLKIVILHCLSQWWLTQGCLWCWRCVQVLVFLQQSTFSKVIFYLTMLGSYWILSRHMRCKIKLTFITFTLDPSITGISIITLKNNYFQDWSETYWQGQNLTVR